MSTSNPIQRPRRQLLQAASAAAVGLGFAAVGLPARAQAQRVRIGYIGDFQGTSLVAVANRLDLWKKHGLAPEIKGFTNGPIQIQALGTGDLDFGYIGPGALWLPMMGKAKIIAINVVGNGDRVIAQPGIKTIADLRGKTVAVPEGTSGDMLLRLALSKAGMRNEDVRRLPMDPATIITAFISGQVDGAALWYPHIATIKNRVPNLVELFGNKDALPQHSFPSSFVMRPSLDNAAGAPLVDAMTRVLKEANDFRHKNVAQSLEWTAELLKAPKANLEAEVAFVQFYSSAELSQLTSDGTVDAWLTGMNEMFRSFGRVADVVDPKTYYLGARYASMK